MVVARARKKFSSTKEDRKTPQHRSRCQASVSLPSGFRKAGGVEFDA
jgi:hypothetical protein